MKKITKIATLFMAALSLTGCTKAKVQIRTVLNPKSNFVEIISYQSTSYGIVHFDILHKNRKAYKLNANRFKLVDAENHTEFTGTHFFFVDLLISSTVGSDFGDKFNLIETGSREDKSRTYIAFPGVTSVPNVCDVTFDGTVLPVDTYIPFDLN